MSANPTAPPDPVVTAASATPPGLLDQLRSRAQARGYADVTAAAFADWARRFILFHGKRHPRELGLAEVGQFLTAVAQTEKDPVVALAVSREALDSSTAQAPGPYRGTRA